MMNYTAQNLLSELRTQGVIISPTNAGNLFLDGELTDSQFNAVKELKPQIIELLKSRPAVNESLFFDLDGSFRVFDVSRKAANLVFLELLKYTERNAGRDEKELCFSQPSRSAYDACLNLAEAIETNGTLQTAFDVFIVSHTLGVPLGEWVQDLPLWQVRIFDGEKEIEFAVCNAVQSAIICGYYSAKNPDSNYKIERA